MDDVNNYTLHSLCWAIEQPVRHSDARLLLILIANKYGYKNTFNLLDFREVHKLHCMTLADLHDCIYYLRFYGYINVPLDQIIEPDVLVTYRLNYER